MRKTFRNTLAILFASAFLWVACGGGSKAPVVQGAFNAGVSVGDLAKATVDTKKGTLDYEVTEGTIATEAQYADYKTGSFTMAWNPSWGKYSFSLTHTTNSKIKAGLLAVPDRFVVSRVGGAFFYIGVPSPAEDVTLAELEEKVYNFVAYFPAQSGANKTTHGTFKILKTKTNASAGGDGQDAVINLKQNLAGSTTAGNNIPLLIKKKAGTKGQFEVFKEGSTAGTFNKKIANFLPRKEADNTFFAIIDFHQDFDIPGIAFAATQKQLTNSDITDGNYEAHNGAGTTVSFGSVSGNKLNLSKLIPKGNGQVYNYKGKEGEMTLELNKPWDGFIKGTHANGSEFIGITSASSELYSIMKAVTTTTSYDAFIAIKQ